MDTLEIIREIEHDDALRASLRAVLLGDEILGIPEQLRLLTIEVRELAEAQQRTEVAQQRTDATVRELVEAQKRTDATMAEAQKRTDWRLDRTEKALAELAEAQKRTEVAVYKLAEDVGEISEVSCAVVLGAVAEIKGWTSLDTPGPIDIGKGEIDVRARFATPDGEVAILAEAKSRLYGKDVSRWADRVGESAWRGRFLYADFTGQVLPYVYGTLIYADAITEAKRLGIGVIGPEGERLAPLPL
ncbi:MAG: hypothetical protein ACYDGY_09845 [Acidimicrobiales bacterium]